MSIDEHEEPGLCCARSAGGVCYEHRATKPASGDRVWILVEEAADQHARDAVHGVSRTREGAMALAGDQVVWRKDGEDGGMRGSVLGQNEEFFVSWAPLP